VAAIAAALATALPGTAAAGSAQAAAAAERAEAPGPKPSKTAPTEEPSPTAAPDPDPSPTDGTSPEPTVTPTTAAPTTAAPTTAAPPPPPTTAPPTTAPPPTTAAPQPSATGVTTPSRLGLRLTTGDVRLSDAYWRAPGTPATLPVMVVNTGRTAVRVALTYALPAGVVGAGTPGCVATGRQTYRCEPAPVAAGGTWRASFAVRVDGQAWRSAPLNGTVAATAVSRGVTVRDEEGFAVLFPPGPPVDGIRIAATDVRLAAPDRPATLDVTLTNDSRVAADGAIEVRLPDAVRVHAAPAGCSSDVATVRCDIGPVPAGRSGRARLSLIGTAEAVRRAPLSGAVFGTLASAGSVKRIQASFRIVADQPAVAVRNEPDPSPDARVPAMQPIATANDDGLTGTRKVALALVVSSAGLILVALGLAILSLRRRTSGERALR
jgi:hypothetical protein